MANAKFTEDNLEIMGERLAHLYNDVELDRYFRQQQTTCRYTSADAYRTAPKEKGSGISTAFHSERITRR